MSNRADYRFFHRLRVRWAEVDMQKIVFNAHYLMYFDTAIADYWRAIGLPYEEAMHVLGGDLYVRKAVLEYNASARMDDRLDIGMRCKRIGSSSITFEGGTFRGQHKLVGCELVYVFADPTTQTSRPVPAALRHLLEKYEAGQEVWEVSVGSWEALGQSAADLRSRVFVRELGLPAAMQQDEHDSRATHAVVANGLGQVLAAARLMPSELGVGRIERLAVHSVMRGTGLGQEIVQQLSAVAAARGDLVLAVNAHRDAVNFYRRLGFFEHGSAHAEAGIDHQRMERPLARA